MTDNNTFYLSPTLRAYNVTFQLEGKEVGRLSWDDGTMKFEGNADESAKIFFDVVIKNCQPFSDIRKAVKSMT